MVGYGGHTNKERFGRSVEILRAALRPLVEERLVEKYGHGWLERVLAKAPHWQRDPYAELDDLSGLLRVIVNEWHLFSSSLYPVGLDLVAAVRHDRNTWAHSPQREFAAASTRDAITRIATILKAIGAETEARSVLHDAAEVTDAAVAVERQLRGLLVEAAGRSQPLASVCRRARGMGLTTDDIAVAAKALRESNLLVFDDPLTAATTLHLS